MTLSVIIPYYNTKELTDALLKVLKPQQTAAVEIIIVDDGSKEKYIPPFKGIKVIYKENGGVSSARNAGLEEASGEYIAFVDSDDMVSFDYISEILKAAEQKPDCIYLSWKTDGKNWRFECDLTKTEFPGWNLCMWNRVYKKELIGEKRFNTEKPVAEDAQMIHEIEVDKIVRVKKFVYIYNTANENSLTKRFIRGEFDFERTIFHYPQIGANMGEILTQVKEANEHGEAILLTNEKNVREFEQFAMVLKPQPIYGTRLIGEPLPEFKLIPKPIKTQVCVYIAKTLKIGGVETWIYNFVSHMSKYYDIIVAFSETMSGEQINRLSEVVQVVKILDRAIICDTLLNMRITDEIPEKIKAKQIIQVCHTCKMKDWKIQRNYDRLIYVSDAARKTFEEPGDVIHNLTLKENKKALLLVTASRFTFEKGAERMNKLARALTRDGVEFVWLVFTADEKTKFENGIVKVPATLDVKPYIKKADYLIQLSDKEAFCYSIVEAMEAGTPVITTPIDVLDEIKFEDRKTGFIIPFDVSSVPTAEIVAGLPEFKYKRDNKKIIEQWREVLGDSKPTKAYKKQSAFLKVLIIQDYGDLELGRNVRKGEILTMRRDRARQIIRAGAAVEA